MLYEIVAKIIGSRYFVNQFLHFGHFDGALVKSKVIARFKVDCGRAVRMLLQINLKDFLGNVVVVQFVVTKSYVDV